MDKKTTPLVVRITQSEKENLEKLCIKLMRNTNKSRLVRKIIREFLYQSPDLLDKEIEVFRDCARNLTGISRNLNQITKKINSGQYSSEILTKIKIESLQNTVIEVNSSMQKYIENSLFRMDGVDL